MIYKYYVSQKVQFFLTASNYNSLPQILIYDTDTYHYKWCNVRLEIPFCKCLKCA